LHHVQDRHEWILGRYIQCAFLNHYNCKYITSCEHDELTGPPTDPDGNPLEYFDRTEKAFRALQKLVLDDKWLLSMKYYINFRFAVGYSGFSTSCTKARVIATANWE